MYEKFNREEERYATVAKLSGARKAEREKLISEYQKRSANAFAPQTLRNYQNIISKFQEWCDETGRSAEPPVAPQVIADYIDAMGGRLRATTIETRLWAISEMHRATFQPSPCRHRLVELALKAVKCQYGAGVRQAPALCRSETLKAIKLLGNSRLEMRDKAVMWIAMDSWCRASEISAFKVRDLCRQDDGTSLLYVAKSKTDPFGMGA